MKGVARPVIVDGKKVYKSLWAAVNAVALSKGRDDEVRKMYTSCYEACKRQRGRVQAYGHTFEFARRGEK